MIINTLLISVGEHSKDERTANRIKNLFSQNYLVLVSRLMTSLTTTEKYPVAKSKIPQKKTDH